MIFQKEILNLLTVFLAKLASQFRHPPTLAAGGFLLYNI